MSLESKSLLAKLMASEDITIEERNVHTASFDVKNRILVVPKLDSNIPNFLYDLFMGHEVGHALYTSLESIQTGLDEKISPSLLNVVEDSRIERKIKYKFPGLKNSFVKGYQHLFDRNFFGTEGKNLDDYNFIDRINLHCKVGALTNIHFNEKESEILKEVESTQTFQDVIDVCKKIGSLILEQEKDSYDDDEYEKDANTSNIDGQQSIGQKPEDLGQMGDDNIDSPTISVTYRTPDESEQSEPSSDTNNMDENGDINTKSDIEPDYSGIESETDKSYRENEKSLFSLGDMDRVYVNIPKINISDVVYDHKKVYQIYKDFQINTYTCTDTRVLNEFPNRVDLEGFQKIRKENNNTVSFLVKEFELRKNAKQLKKSSTSKTGELNMDKIYSYGFNEDIFKKISVMPNEKSHGLVMFLDWSGSMVEHLENTLVQLFNLVMFCRKVNIPYEVYTFVDKSDHGSYYTMKTGDIIPNQFLLMNILSSRMSAAEFTYAASALVYMCKVNSRYGQHYVPDIFYMGGTPLNEAMMAAMEIVPEFQKKNQLQIVNTIFLTDGEGDIINGVIGKSNIWWSNLVIRDPVTRHQVVLNSSRSRQDQTSAFANLLKQRTGCNVIGFYLLSTSGFKRFANRYGYKYFSNYNEQINTFSAKNYTIIENSGFDEYYLLKSKSNTDVTFDVKKNATTKGLVSAFNKFHNKKNTNKVILNRFINLIV